MEVPGEHLVEHDKIILHEILTNSLPEDSTNPVLGGIVDVVHSLGEEKTACKKISQITWKYHREIQLHSVVDKSILYVPSEGGGGDVYVAFSKNEPTIFIAIIYNIQLEPDFKGSEENGPSLRLIITLEASRPTTLQLGVVFNEIELASVFDDIQSPEKFSTILAEQVEHPAALNNSNEPVYEQFLATLTPSADDNHGIYVSSRGLVIARRIELPGNFPCINQAMSLVEAEDDYSTEGHMCYLAQPSRSGSCVVMRFKRTGDLAEIANAIFTQQRAIGFTSARDTDMLLWLNNYGNSVQRRFDGTPYLTGISNAISTKQKDIQSSIKGHMDMPTRFNDLVDSFQTRCKHTSDLAGIESTMYPSQKTVRLTPDGHTYLSTQLNNYSNAFPTSFECTSDCADITIAIFTHQKAIYLILGQHKDNPTWFDNLGMSCQKCFECTGILADMAKLISSEQWAIHLTPQGYENMPTWVRNRWSSMKTHIEHTGNQVEIATEVSIYQRAVQLNPIGHASLPTRLNNLRKLFQMRFKLAENVADIASSIFNWQGAIQLTLEGNTNMRPLLNNPVISFQVHYKHTDDLAELTSMISNQKWSIQATSEGNSGIPSDLNLSPLPGYVSTFHRQRLYALIIGINDYLSLPKLSGAVNDAKAMEEFLKSNMHVPADRIRLLLNHNASRKEILNVFKQISEENKIKTGDPILIYYAGHGAQLRPPKNWEAGGAKRKIQAICPYDYAKGITHSIPDRTIGAFLDLICEKKGNNITVIFDCCHSASGTRVVELSTKIRGVELDDELPVDLDRSELSTTIGRGSSLPTNFGVRGLRSHVFVAACKEAEYAMEENDGGGGRFTSALLELFNQEGRMETLTYTDILKHIRPIQNQNPQVEGIHRNRIIFDPKAAHHYRRPFYSVQFDTQKHCFILGAGSVDGITFGSQFTVYEDPDSVLKSCPWGSLHVSNVMEFTSFLQRSDGSSGPDLNKPGTAVLSVNGPDQTLAVMASYDPLALPPGILEAVQRMEKQHIVSLVGQNAKVEMDVQNCHLIFNILDPNVTKYGLDRVYHTVKPTSRADDVARILSAARNFFWHLRRGHDHAIIHDLHVEFMELQVSKNRLGPTGYPILSPSEENLLQGGTIDLQVGSVRKPYGIKLTNNSEWDLFPSVFYFDHGDWSIGDYYHAGTAGQFDAEAPLRKRGGTLTIGYGAGGHDPICFYLNEGQDLDVGHLKIFFSTKAVDLRHIEQQSPFTETRDCCPTPPPSVDIATWVALQYPIIQRRGLVDSFCSVL